MYYTSCIIHQIDDAQSFSMVTMFKIHVFDFSLCSFPVNLDHFQILRAIGKGSFGKVSCSCINMTMFLHPTYVRVVYCMYYLNY